MPSMPKGLSPLTIPAGLLSGASLAWTTWSLVDLLGTGHIGITVAAGADVVWAAVIVAEARGLRIPAPVGKGRNLVPVIGWLALLAVAGLLVWHGIRAGSIPMAVAGPLLPLGSKVVWLLALADMRDPAALTDDERTVLARMERGLTFEEAQHHIEMRRREMTAELYLSEVDVDFRIERSRQDKGRELQRRRSPLELSPAEPLAHRAEPLPEPPAQHDEPTHLLHSSTQVAASEPPAQQDAPVRGYFGFSAQLTGQQAQRAQAVERVAELLAQDPGLTSAQVAERLSVSAATAKRYLRDARQT